MFYRFFFIDVYFLKSINRLFKIFLQVYKNENEYYYIDIYHETKSNWMRYVQPAFDVSEQNLVACQVKGEIYFYTFKPILPNQELKVWYCKEYAKRLQATIEVENGIRKHCLIYF